MLGLNFLVDNQVDQAIDELTQATSFDTDALEIQMILGNLYRQKGQVGRAINIHQGLLQRPDLTKLEHAYVLLCLGWTSGTAASSIGRSKLSRKSCASILAIDMHSSISRSSTRISINGRDALRVRRTGGQD